MGILSQGNMLPWLLCGSLVAVTIGLLWYIRRLKQEAIGCTVPLPSGFSPEDDDDGYTENEYSSDDECKMVFCIRKDLKMQPGKVAAQCCHACLSAFILASNRYGKWVESWGRSGQAKVTLRIDSQEQLMQLYEIAVKNGLPARYICDAGRTQVEPGSKTVLAIGPAPSSLIDEITGDLKLY